MPLGVTIPFLTSWVLVVGSASVHASSCSMGTAQAPSEIKAARLTNVHETIDERILELLCMSCSLFARSGKSRLSLQSATRNSLREYNRVSQEPSVDHGSLPTNTNK